MTRSSGKPRTGYGSGRRGNEGRGETVKLGVAAPGGFGTEEIDELTICRVVSCTGMFCYSVCPIIKPWNPSILFLNLRTFVDARIKWVRDPYLDFVVEREKNLLPCLSLKHLLLSSPSFSLPISLASLHKPRLNLPSHTTSLFFFQRYPSLFILSPPIVKLTPQFLTLHQEEQQIHDSMSHKEFAAQRLVRLLMLTRACRIPISILDNIKFDLGLPDNYLLDLVSYFPEYFRICTLKFNDKVNVGNDNRGNFDIGLELIDCRKELCVPAIIKEQFGDELGNKRGRIVKFPMSFAPGFDLQKKVKDWVEEWQCLPYISPYEDAFHLAPRSDQAEKWTVAVLHEFLSILVSKKTEMKNVLQLGDYLGFGLRFKKALIHHPGIFYISNKIKTQTVVLREAFRKDLLLQNHPLIGMRHRYIYLMNKSRKRKLVKKPVRLAVASNKV